MTAKYATRNAILVHIRADTEPRVRQKIVKYMWKKYGTSPAATRQQLQRLCKEGVLEQVEPGRYQQVGDGAESTSNRH